MSCEGQIEYEVNIRTITFMIVNHTIKISSIAHNNTKELITLYANQYILSNKINNK